jgi:hypothetical protein
MGLGSRFGLIFTNFAILMPVFIVLIVTAITTSIASAKINSLKDQTEAIKKSYKYVTLTTIALWCLFAGGIFGGIFFIPFLALFPYLFGGIMFLFAIINMVMAGVMFYAAISVKNTSDYKNNNNDAKSAYNQSVYSGLGLMFASIFMVGYSIWSIYHYNKIGGLTGDVAIAAQIVPFVAPEFAIPASMAGQYAQQQLGQQQYQNTGAQNIPALKEAGAQIQQASQGMSVQQGLAFLAKNPDLAKNFLKAMA